MGQGSAHSQGEPQFTIATHSKMTVQNRFHLLYVDEPEIPEGPKVVLGTAEPSAGKASSAKKPEKEADAGKAAAKQETQTAEPLDKAQKPAKAGEGCEEKVEQKPVAPPLQLKSYKEYLAEQTARLSALSLSRPEQRRLANDGAKAVDGFEPVMPKATSLAVASAEDAWMMGSGASPKKAGTKPVASKQFVEVSVLAFKSVSSIEDDSNAKYRDRPRRFERDQRPFESRPRKPAGEEQADGQKREFRPRRDQAEGRSFRPRSEDGAPRSFRPRRDDAQHSSRPRDPRPEMAGVRAHASSMPVAGHREEEFPTLA